jgi:hypothetical protein
VSRVRPLADAIAADPSHPWAARPTTCTTHPGEPLLVVTGQAADRSATVVFCPRCPEPPPPPTDPAAHAFAHALRGRLRQTVALPELLAEPDLPEVVRARSLEHLLQAGRDAATVLERHLAWADLAVAPLQPTRVDLREVWQLGHPAPVEVEVDARWVRTALAPLVTVLGERPTLEVQQAGGRVALRLTTGSRVDASVQPIGPDAEPWLALAHRFVWRHGGTLLEGRDRAGIVFALDLPGPP